ncbi:hypothetical protein WJX77_010630 [Trebouxia sp. C0004]
MAAALHINANCCSVPKVSTSSHPPINFFYSHFHNSIRNELDTLSHSVSLLTSAAQEDVHESLSALKNRYRFLEQVYKYHSSVEDEVVYPALDAKVKNVTSAYSVEHEDEERLFEQLSALLSIAVRQDGRQRAATLRQLECKIEEVHTTLRKHLAKEEEQLFPLLLKHFTFAEQAELVAQFLCCIPLATVEVVLAWLKPVVPEEEQAELLNHVKDVVSDRLLVQLLSTWLSPASQPQRIKPCCPSAAQATPSFSPSKCCKAQLGVTVLCADDCAQQQMQISKKQQPAAASGSRPPLQEITYIHAAIRSALESFAVEAHSMQGGAIITTNRLKALVEKHRFLRSVCTFHSASEDEVLLPAARKLMTVANDQHAKKCEMEHQSEGVLMEELGRLLGEVKASARRGAKEADELILELGRIADAVRGDTNKHMAHEEQEVLPLLEAHLCAAEQRAMVWRTLRAMPLRLLERVMPWVAGKLNDEEAAEMLQNMQLAAPEVDSVLVQLLSRWAERGRDGSPRSQDGCNFEDFINSTCAPSSPTKVINHSDPAPSVAHSHPPLLQHGQGKVRPAGPLAGADVVLPQQKRRRTASSHHRSASHVPAATGNSSGAVDSARPQALNNPIDHIFQFHKALKRDLRYMEQDASAFASAVEEASDKVPTHAIQQLKGRFRFLWGMYKAHSEAEDEIVFPALESKDALRNVSHAYSLDHQQEEQLFKDIHEVFNRIQPSSSLQELRQHSSQLQRMCAAMRATLEQHVRAEEHELWPLFNEHFSVEEQQHIVGMIIGRSGAEVLQAMLPWITDSITEGEQRAMMDSLRSATQNTMFEQWLDATMKPVLEPKQHQLHQQQVSNSQSLDDVVEYFTGIDQGLCRPGEGIFKPGWEDIFRMNQKQLEGAVRRMWSDPGLEPQRKAYLMQNIMASRYIVAQQRRHGAVQGSGEIVSVLEGSPAQQGKPVYRSYNQPDILGCQHYKRRCQLIGSCCNRPYVCRHCHDEAEDHRLEASAVTHMVCMECGEQQKPAAECRACHAGMARYHCSICQLFDNEPGRDIYHCPFCNLCRLGKGLGRDVRHCMQCNCCMDLAEFKQHKCRDLSTCPVCTEYLFDSNSPYRELPCGHFMHSHCFGQYTRYNYTCPVCSKTMGDMSMYFRMIDSLVARSDDLPPGYATRKQVILCNDCEQKGEAPFHFVYHKCSHCNSYNTRLT